MSIPFRGTYGTLYYVRDLPKAIQFYRATLGREPSVASSDWAEFDFDGHALCLHATQGEADPVGGVLILKVQGIRQAMAALKEQGVEFGGELKEVHPGAYSIDFCDPDGNWVSLYENISN